MVKDIGLGLKLGLCNITQSLSVRVRVRVKQIVIKVRKTRNKFYQKKPTTAVSLLLEIFRLVYLRAIINFVGRLNNFRRITKTQKLQNLKEKITAPCGKFYRMMLVVLQICH